MQAKKLRTALLVDDDTVVIASLQHALSQAGFYVLIAADGREALLCHDQCRDPIDLLITDLHMPEMSGQELARRILARCPGLPIIFISGDPDAEPFPTEADFPGHVFLQKPFLPSELMARLPK